MGKGDKKSGKGKLAIGTFGVRRKARKKKTAVAAAPAPKAKTKAKK